MSIFRRWRVFKLFEALVFIFLVFLIVFSIQSYLSVETNIARFVQLREKNIEILELIFNNLSVDESYVSDESSTIEIIEIKKAGILKLLYIKSGNIDAKAIMFDSLENDSEFP